MPRSIPAKAMHRHYQSGIAAIEFAMIAALMTLMLIGGLVYWRVLQAQQSVTRSAGDGARLVQNLIYGNVPGYDITKNSDRILTAASDVVKKSLQASGIPGNAQQNVSITLDSNTHEAKLSVVYKLPPLFSDSSGAARPLQLGNWALTEPASLQATAVVSYGSSAGATP